MPLRKKKLVIIRVLRAQGNVLERFKKINGCIVTIFKTHLYIDLLV